MNARTGNTVSKQALVLPSFCTTYSPRETVKPTEGKQRWDVSLPRRVDVDNIKLSQSLEVEIANVTVYPSSFCESLLVLCVRTPNLYIFLGHWKTDECRAVPVNNTVSTSRTVVAELLYPFSLFNISPPLPKRSYFHPVSSA